LSFVVWAALAVAGFVVGPVIAHLLRRGRAKEKEFPAAALVPALASTARQRSRLEDWPLLTLRSAMIIGLAVLGATPLVRCERLSLTRASGASVALAVVLDDSLSMRATLPNGKTRWAIAKSGAAELLQSVREGDSVTIVLAGRPARIALAPTSDVAAAERALEDVKPSDRSTDLAGAVQLARAAVRTLPQKDHRVVVLSDLAGDPLPGGTPSVATPLPELSTPTSDCAITSADRHLSHVLVTVACSDEEVATGRGVEVVVAKGATGAVEASDGGPRVAPGGVIARATLSPRRGEQTVELAVDKTTAALDARLDGTDSLSQDDEAAVSEAPSAPLVGVVADATTSTAKTGGPTVVEQALSALGDEWTVRPLPFVPDDPRVLTGVGALVLDDPRGLSPESRSAMTQFLERGGVAAALLGPRAGRTELGGTLEPFARGAPHWEDVHELGMDLGSLAWLGPESASLASVARRGRLRLDGSEIQGARVVGRWSDQVPFLLERHVGRGLAITVGLPASLEESDLALRPAFLALLDHVLRQADQREGSRRTLAGAPWTFPGASRVSIEGPEGNLAAAPEPSDDACVERGARPGCGDTVLRATPGVHGRYVAHVDGAAETRTVTLDPGEISTAPRPRQDAEARDTGTRTASVNVSREVALALIGLFGAELILRVVRRWMARRQGDSTAAT
jgi:Mg-chelatase subunit ChlD